MLYHLNEFKNVAMMPTKMWSDAVGMFASAMPTEADSYSKILSASSQIIGRSAMTFDQPQFGLSQTVRHNEVLKVVEKKIMVKPFCTLRYFQRQREEGVVNFKDPKVLICAPLSGHFATLLRDTVKAMLPHHEVYITDWHNARDVPLKEGKFNFQTYIDYLLDFIRHLGKDLHIIAVCQPAVPVLSTVSLLAEYNEPCQPRTMTLMGGPIDTRVNPGPVNQFAEDHSMLWFKNNLISKVPGSYVGAGREVCPGFLMLQGFMSLNVQRHQEANFNLFKKLIQGDREGAEAHTKFYDEYRAVLDMPADYYLDSIRIAFKEHLLPKGLLTWRGYLIRPEKIKKTALMTVEGELDEISCSGQTYAAHELCSKLPDTMRSHYLQLGTGHYGIFNGRRWREEIQPLISLFIREHDRYH
ncbi:polyhydroxyalkanoate depolymerase [Candidatus Odyssella acanthamoebae]|uniref:Poly(3-hydroxybutyrate) depolymerase n=1 Tax=Candidatus Odyssella acanthamoebae TaxID=91604 RepID=A0A077B116_9PROT|nr:polyhydroxyalkanoate depolymerase [Candidatus Paracaedibacter acanthamoebae]AIK96640.1 poly(3-hydroxybutyrate) depolymerase [Candidatus Paracaedibacter acanthamoebae]